MGKTITGIVTSDVSDKTIVITVVSRKTDPIYKKQYSVRTKFMAHDENNEAKLGDKVSIKETRPMSTRKRFILDKVLEKAAVGFQDSDAVADVPKTEKTKEEKQSEPAEAKE